MRPALHSQTSGCNDLPLAASSQQPSARPTRAHLQAGLDPVELRDLEELGGLEGLEEVLLVLVLRGAVVQLVEHQVLEQLLVAHAHLHRVPAHTRRVAAPQSA